MNQPGDALARKRFFALSAMRLMGALFIIAGFLLVTMNNRKLLGDYRNGPLANVLGGAIFLVVTGLAVYQLADLAGLLG